MSRGRKPYVQASFPPAGEVFRFDGSNRLCPACDVFLTMNKSKAVRLPRPLAVQYTRNDTGKAFSSITGRPFYADGRWTSSMVKPKWYVHERCYKVALDILGGAL